MINNKKGLSAIITTLLVILLVLVAVGIVWAVVSGIINNAADVAALSATCLSINVEAVAVTCAESAAELCNVTFDRSGTGTDEIAGVKLVFRDSVTPDDSAVIEVTGDIENLVGKTELAINTTLIAPDSVEVTVFFEDTSGNEDPCPGDPEIFSFVNVEP